MINITDFDWKGISGIHTYSCHFQILLISDGSVWNVDQMTELVSRHAHESRVFAVGIGHGASTSLIRGVARAGKGRSEMVFQQDKIQHKVRTF